MGRLVGKVAVVSGAARGQGRAHAVALAREGASIVAFDILEPLTSPRHEPATQADLDETVAAVEKQDQRILAVKADARDLGALQELAERAMTEFGRIDVVVVNHGIWPISESTWETEESDWQEGIDVLLSGAFKTVKAFVPKIVEGGRGGSIILTSSVMGLKAQPSSATYTVAKHGVLGLMRTLAWEGGKYGIRANAVLPGTVDTQMIQGPTREQSLEWQPRFFPVNRALLPGGDLLPPEVIAKAVVFLASDEAEFITGAALPVDAGWLTF